MKRLLRRLFVLALLCGLYLLGNGFLTGLQESYNKPQILRFSLPLPPQIMTKYGIDPVDIPAEIERVQIAGFFNDWDSVNTNYSLIRKDMSNWEISLRLPQGPNQYKFVVYTRQDLYPPVWVPNIHESRMAYDGFDGSNSVHIIPSFRNIQFYFNVIIIGLIGLILGYALMDPVIRRILHLTMPFRLKLLLLMLILGLIPSAAIITYNLYEHNDVLHESRVDLANMVHNYLVSASEIDLSLIDNPSVRSDISQSLGKLVRLSHSRQVPGQPSSLQLTISTLAVFNTNRELAAFAFKEEMANILSNEITRLKLTGVRELSEQSYWGWIITNKELSLSTYSRFSSPARQVFPLFVDNRHAGYYALLFHNPLYDSLFLRILVSNLILLVLFGLLFWVILRTVGAQVTQNLEELSGWTLSIINGDYTVSREIRTGDEVETLARNFNSMRLSLGGNIRNIETLNRITGQMKRIRSRDDLFAALIYYLVAPQGLDFGRAGLFIENDGVLTGAYGIDKTEVELPNDEISAYDHPEQVRALLKSGWSAALSVLSVLLDRSTSALARVYHSGRREVYTAGHDFTDSLDIEMVRRLELTGFALMPLMVGSTNLGVILVDSGALTEGVAEDTLGRLEVILNDFSIQMDNILILENLEKTVRERTGELQAEKAKVEEKSREVEHERNALQVRNQIIEAELEMARRIQENMIPSVPPRPYIASLYKPMEKVGGDFFDFIEFPESDELGIFVSDVSGHGVAAAFITSMIKSFILQSGERKRNPGELLLYLNSLLEEQTAGNFVTALYGVYNPATHTFIYANAGHNQPYLVRPDGSVERLDHPYRAIPLAILGNEELQSLDRHFVNREFSLSPGEKIVLYTDGLIESVPLGNTGTDFERSGLREALSENRAMKAPLYVKSIMERLVAFRGSDDFEDDVCLICIDVMPAL